MSAISQIQDSSGTLYDIKDSRVAVATASNVGMIKPDGVSTTIDQDGTLHATAGSSQFSVDGDGYIIFGV